MRLLLTCLICFSLSSWVYADDIDQETEEWLQNTRITSHLKNVIVVGVPKEIALEVAIWAESVIEEIQDWSASPIPGNYVYPIVIRAEERKNETQGFVIASQYMTDGGHVRQKLTIVNRALVDREDLLEGFCHLLLNRWVHVRQSKQSLANRPGQFPHWFSYGIAQSLFPDLMSRNLNVIKAEEKKDQYKPALSIITQQVLPPGRWPEKARAGLVMNWFSQEALPSVFMPEAARIVADQKVLDDAFLLQQVGAVDRAAFNAKWDLWMARQDDRIVPGVMADDTEKLSRVLEMRADDLGLAHPAVPGKAKVPVLLLIEERNMAWAWDVSKIMGWKLRFESVGKTRNIQDRIAPFLEFYELMLRKPRELPGMTGKHRKKIIKPPSARLLKKKWRNAEAGWSKFIEQQENRRTFLDSYESSEPAVESNVHDLLDRWQEENL